MSTVAKKIMMGSGAAGDPVDDQFNRTSFLSHFEGANNGVNSQFTDGSASNHTITANGNATQGSFGPFARPDGEWGVSFDGSGDRVRANWAENVGTSDFTIEAWVFVPSNMDQYDCIAWLQESLHSNASENGFFIRANSSNTIEFAVLSGSTIYNAVSSAISFNEWHHLSISKSGTTMYYSVDGTVANRSAPSGINDSDYLNIGAADANGSLSYPFKGLISNVRFLIGTALYTSSFTPSTSSLTAITNTKFLGCQSNRFVDNSSNGYTITPSGNPAVTAFGPFLTSSVYNPAVNGASAYFDGSDDLTIPNSSDFNLSNNPFTFSFWANFSDGGTLYARYNYPSSQRETFIATEDDGTIRMRISSNGTSFSDHATASGVFVFNQWNYIVITRTISGSDSVFKTYVNGTLSKTTTINLTTIYNASQTTYIMNYGAIADRPTGYLCDFKLVNGTATAADSSNPTAPATNTTNTKLLLNMADGQAIDSAAQPEWTATTVANGTPKLQTGEKKIGTSSLYFDGSSNYYFPNGFLPGGTGDFTIEFWFRASNTNDNATILTAGGIYFQFYNNKLRYFPYNGGAYIDSSTISTNTWYHLAGVRSGTTFYFFLDGTSQGTLTSVTSAVSTGAGYFGMNGIYPYTGYIDEMRISRMARYTSNFTPDTEPFADKGK